jgi:hypothetical protein
MSTKSTKLEQASKWDTICFPVEVVPLVDLLNEPYLLPSDRNRAVVGEMTPGRKTIFAMQSGEYTLIPNKLVREVADRELPGHKLSASFTDRGEFSLSIVMPDEVSEIATTGNSQVRDRLFRSLIINNSYSGKTPFSLQGSAEWEKEVTGRRTEMRVSYFREICTNGLMGWADDYYTIDEYLQWLAAGKPTKHRKIQQEREAELVERVDRRVTREHEILIERKFHHKGLNLDMFRKHLEQAFQQFIKRSHSLTSSIYKELARKPVEGDREKLFTDTKLPKKLAAIALERLAHEETLLQTEANMWLAYNAANYALFNSKSSLAINDRFRQDEQLFHHFAELAMS